MDDQSQLIVSYSARFGYLHDSREFRKVLKNMDRKIVGKFKIIVGDKGYDSEENHVVAGEHGLLAVIYRQEMRTFKYIELGKKTGKG